MLDLLPLIRVLIVILVIYIPFRIVTKLAKKFLMGRAKTKKEKSNVQIFFEFLNYVVIFLLLVFAILSYAGSWVGIGLTAGLISAALGWALQRPITGIAAWLMLVIKRPFEIGDRVIIGNVKGDVVDITLTHVHVREIGGTVASEETSGREILIPNAKLFDVDIVNYTKTDELILDQVTFAITYDSDLERAKEIAIESAKEVLKHYIRSPNPYIRTWFQPSGIDVVVRYYVPAAKREEVSSRITQEIFRRVSKSKRVRFAYPHQEIILRKK